jgi:hypothetical protein
MERYQSKSGRDRGGTETLENGFVFPVTGAVRKEMRRKEEKREDEDRDEE